MYNNDPERKPWAIGSNFEYIVFREFYFSIWCKVVSQSVWEEVRAASASSFSHSWWVSSARRCTSVKSPHASWRWWTFWERVQYTTVGRECLVAKFFVAQDRTMVFLLAERCVLQYQTIAVVSVKAVNQVYPTLFLRAEARPFIISWSTPPAMPSYIGVN